MKSQQLLQLQEKLGYMFLNPALLESALTHSSYANENKNSGAVSNERLEFLGDSVLGMTVSTLLYKNQPNMPEGRMTRLRAELVCEKSLASFAAAIGLGECLRLGRGEEKGGGRNRTSILADAVEAVIASVYLDGGIEPVSDLIEKHLVPNANNLTFESTDFKTALQEVIQEKPGQTLSYQIIQESGPDHMKSFVVEVLLNGIAIGRGSGKSKKEAEQAAAKSALEDGAKGALREES